MNTHRWTRSIVPLVLVIMVYLALGGTLEPATAIAHAAPPPQNTDATLRIINDSDQTICYVFIVPVAASDLGGNRLGDDNDAISPGETYSFDLSQGEYNVLLTDCQESFLLFKDDIIVSGVYELRLTSLDLCKAFDLKGMYFDDQNQYSKALLKFQDALACYRELEDRAGEATTLNNIGVVYYNLGQVQRALDYYHQTLAIRQEIGDLAGQAAILSNISDLYYYRLRQYKEALGYFHQILIIQQEIEDQLGELRTLNKIGYIYYNNLGQYGEALIYIQQALDIQQEIDDHAGEGDSLNNIGGIYYRLGQYEEALGYFQRARIVHQNIGDHIEEARNLNNSGGMYNSLGQYQKALGDYQQALSIWQKIRDRAGEAITLNNIGGVYYGLGQYEDSLGYFQKALNIRRETGDRIGEVRTLNNIGVVYYSLGQYEDSLNYYQQALKTIQKIGESALEGTILNNIGSVYYDLEQYKDSLNYYQQALKIIQKIGDRASEGITLNNIGGIYYDLGQYEDSLNYYQQALKIMRGISDRAGEGTSLNNIGGAYRSLERYEEALDYSQRALAILQEIGDRRRESECLKNIGFTYYSLGQYDVALRYYEQAIALFESVRGEMTVDEIKSGFAARQVYMYDDIISLLTEIGRPEDAFGYVQRAKGRTFLDQLGNVRVSPVAESDPALVQQEEQLRGEIQSLDKQLREEWAKPQDQYNDEVILSIATQLETKRADYARLLQTLKLNNPEYASLVTVVPLTLTDTQKILTNTTLIEYYVTADQTIAFVVTQNDFHAMRVSVTQEGLVDSIQNFQEFGLDPSQKGVPGSTQALYQHLIAPLKSYIQTELVVISPHNVLHYVPFGALYDGEHYLVEEYTLFYTPSASALPFAFAKRKSGVAVPLILGDPDGSLPDSRQEAQAIAQLYSTSAHVGGDALERWVWEQGQEASILHLSTHGVYNDRSPLFSHVLLAADDTEDGRLNVYEIYNRGLNLEKADLVVLSACQTNVGKLSRGDEIVGLSRALIYAGAPSVIASLWSVRDESTRVLLEKFYTHLRKGMSKAGALRAAQMEMIASDKYLHPYHWAAFGVIGDPGEGKLPKLTTTSEKTGEGICSIAALPLVMLMLIGAKRYRQMSN